MDRPPAPFDDPHREVRELLPWYVTGQLGEPDRARVAAHLACCADCRDELAAERAIGAEVAGMPLDVELGWLRMSRALDQAERPRRLPASLMRLIADRPRSAMLLIAAQFVLLIAAIAFLPSVRQPGDYRVLASSAAKAHGDILVMFAPDAPAADVAALLAASGARIVDGPTTAGAFLLTTPAGAQATALASLRGSRRVTLAEPVER